MISLAFLNPRGHELDEKTLKSLTRLCKAMLQLEHKRGLDVLVTSGYRTREEQLEVNPAHPNSLHCEGLAVDCDDRDKMLWAWCIDNLDFVSNTCGLYLEDKIYTPKHVHFQLKAPASGHRIFIP